MNSKLLFIYLLQNIFLNLVKSDKDVEDVTFHRSKRQLLFPNVTLLQFNAGVGTPTPNKLINVNWAFQANFNLPWNRTQIPVDILEANSGYVGFSRKKRDENSIDEKLERNENYASDARLIYFYKYVEDMLTSFGHNGSSCVLQTLCRLGNEPLYSNDDEDLLHELVNFVLNPNNDLVSSMKEKDDNYPYVEAYNRGQHGVDCSTLYECGLTLIDLFTKIHENV